MAYWCGVGMSTSVYLFEHLYCLMQVWRKSDAGQCKVNSGKPSSPVSVRDMFTAVEIQELYTIIMVILPWRLHLCSASSRATCVTFAFVFGQQQQQQGYLYDLLLLDVTV